MFTFITFEGILYCEEEKESIISLYNEFILKTLEKFTYCTDNTIAWLKEKTTVLFLWKFSAQMKLWKTNLNVLF